MSIDRRQHDRFPLEAQVEVTHSGSVHQLRVLNVSRSGLFLEVDDWDEVPELDVGAEVNVRIFDEDLGEDTDVLVMGEVVRVVEGGGLVAAGVALRFTEIGEADVELLDAVLARAGGSIRPA